MKTLILLLIACHIYALSIIDKPIIFNKKRVSLSKDYLHQHYGLTPKNIKIKPRIIVVHWTAENDFNKSFERFKSPILPKDRGDIQKASSLNVSAHFLISKEGKVYRLMPETTFARHVIGLNYSAIGIENVGGEKGINNLSPLQLRANIKLIHYLTQKYPKIEYLIGHHEYTQCQNLDLWLEKDDKYRTVKHDPGEVFMKKLRDNFVHLQSCSKKHP